MRAILAAAVLFVGALARAAGPGIPPGRGLDGCEGAVTAARAALAASPGDADRQVALAEALVCVMRVRTDGNVLLAEGRNDTDEHRAIWRELAPEAVAAARAAREQRPDDARALGIYAEAYMFDASSQGIVEAILGGAAGQFKENAQTLIDRYPEYENGGGYVHLGSFYFVAPWPIANPKRGLELLERAVAVAPGSRRNRYMAGVGAYRLEEYEHAAEHFEAVEGGTCTTPSEIDLCDFVTSESRRLAGLARARANGAAPGR